MKETVEIIRPNQEILAIRLENFEPVNKEYWNKKSSKLKEVLEEHPEMPLEEIIISIKTLFQDFEAFVFTLFLKNRSEQKEINYSNGKLTEYNYHTFALDVYYYENGELEIQTKKNDIYNKMVEKINNCLAEISILSRLEKLDISYKDNILLETFKNFYNRNIDFKNPNDLIFLQDMMYILKEYNALDEYVRDYSFEYCNVDYPHVESSQLIEWFNHQSYLSSLLYDASSYVGIDDLKIELTKKIYNTIAPEIQSMSGEEQLVYLNNIANLLYVKKVDGEAMYNIILNSSKKGYSQVLKELDSN